jgi:hypothetical protein
MLTLGTIDVPRGGVLLVEANGTSDFITFIAMRHECRRLTSPMQVTIIDAVRWQKRRKHDLLKQEQVKISTHWMLTHTAGVTTPRLARTRKTDRWREHRRHTTDQRCRLEAGIYACHCLAADEASTDWPRILSLYDQLMLAKPTAVVAMNRCVALARVRGAAEALRVLEGIPDRQLLESRHLYHAIRAWRSRMFTGFSAME